MVLAPSTHLFHGKLVTLFGGGGFLGRHTAQALMQAGARVRIVQRQPHTAYAIRSLGNLGQVQFVAADAGNGEAVLRAAIGSDAIVNLIGVLSGNFQRAHVTAAANIAAAASAQNAVLAHVSAIGADPASASAYGRSKAAGEQATRAAAPGAMILRPSIIFGRQDRFINRFASLLRKAPVFPVVAPTTRFQPVFVGDVADAIVAALVRAQAGEQGRTFELGGPRVMTMRELIEWIAQTIGRRPILMDVPDAVAGGLASATGWLPGAPLTRDQWAMLGRDTIVSAGAATLADLDIAPTPLEAVARGWLDIYRRQGRFGGKGARLA